MSAGTAETRSGVEMWNDLAFVARFTAKYEVTLGCWLWTGANVRGRGTISYRDKMILAPRAAKIIADRAWPDSGLHACHSCDTPSCVNPAHIWWGSNAQNGQDAASKGRLHHQKRTHCAKGHALSGENVRLTKGRRVCRICSADRQNRWRSSQPASAVANGDGPQTTDNRENIVTSTLDQQAVPVAQEAMYLIRKGGYFYRPNAQGYTSEKAAAGRYTLAEAISYSHPNGANGPRDGIDYMLDDEPAAPKCPACDGTKVVSQGGHDTGCDACYVSPQTLPAPGEVELERRKAINTILARLLSDCTATASLDLQIIFGNSACDKILATVAAANDVGVAELRDLEAGATRGEWSVAEGSVEDGSIYIDADDTGDRPVAMIMSGSPHNQDRADAAFIVAAVAFARAAIRLLSQGGGKA